MKHYFLLICCIIATSISLAQQNNNTTLDKESIISQKFKVSGYMQTQFQYGEKNASLSVGAKNENIDNSYSRIGIRRGRIKLSYEERIISGAIQVDIIEKGIGLKDAYINLSAPIKISNSLRAGVFNRPFGDEIEYSSSLRQAPERSNIFRTLFPEERDLGAMITLQPHKTSSLSFMKLQAGLFAGNGIQQETDSRKDFIGHLSASKSLGRNIHFSIGTSYYNGGVYQTTENVYKMAGNKFTINTNSKNIGKYAKREYIGFDTQIRIISRAGNTSLRAEYIFGTQPGTQNSSKSPNSSTLIVADTYIRCFNGGYITIEQGIGSTPFSIVSKFDWYNPNTHVSGNDIGLNDTGKADISFNTLGVGLLWSVTNNLNMQAYYDFVNNETSDNLKSLNNNIKDNLFTFRLQCTF